MEGDRVDGVGVLDSVGEGRGERVQVPLAEKVRVGTRVRVGERVPVREGETETVRDGARERGVGVWVPLTVWLGLPVSVPVEVRVECGVSVGEGVAVSVIAKVGLGLLDRVEAVPCDGVALAVALRLPERLWLELPDGVPVPLGLGVLRDIDGVEVGLCETDEEPEAEAVIDADGD